MHHAVRCADAVVIALLVMMADAYLTMMVCRVGILVDFSLEPAGTTFTVRNLARAPYPGNNAPQFPRASTVMRLTVTANVGFTPQPLPSLLNPGLAQWPSLDKPDDDPAHQMVIYVPGAGVSVFAVISLHSVA